MAICCLLFAALSFNFLIVVNYLFVHRTLNGISCTTNLVIYKCVDERNETKRILMELNRQFSRLLLHFSQQIFNHLYNFIAWIIPFSTLHVLIQSPSVLPCVFVAPAPGLKHLPAIVSVYYVHSSNQNRSLLLLLMNWQHIKNIFVQIFVRWAIVTMWIWKYRI